MAVYNGGIRFAPDVYYEIREDDGDITVLRNGEEIGGSGGVDMPIFTIIFDSEGETITSAVCDKTFEQCKAYIESNIPYAAVVEFFAEEKQPMIFVSTKVSTENYIDYAFIPFSCLRYESNGTISLVEATE